VPNVLTVTALEVCDPVAVLILVIANDPLLHRQPCGVKDDTAYPLNPFATI
jgi:hypothetical protein